jgi:hypothetical protein
MFNIELLSIFIKSPLIDETYHINGKEYVYTKDGWMEKSEPITLRDIVLTSTRSPGTRVCLNKSTSEINRADEEARLIFPITNNQWLSFIDHQVYWPALIHVYDNRIEIEFTPAPFDINWMTPNIDLSLCDLSDQELWIQYGSFATGGTLVTRNKGKTEMKFLLESTFDNYVIY